MITIEADKIYCLYCRTNRNVKWRYADYGGRHETVKKAIEKAKEHYTEKSEYIVEDIEGNLIVTGFVNA